MFLYVHYSVQFYNIKLYELFEGRMTLLLVLLIVGVFCSSCALVDPYSYRQDLDFVDGKYYK
jgi:hypothetical protein